MSKEDSGENIYLKESENIKFVDEEKIIPVKNEENNSKEEKKASDEIDKLNEEDEDDDDVYFLRDPRTFKRKRDFFSFYSKRGYSRILPNQVSINSNYRKINPRSLFRKKEERRFSESELNPRSSMKKNVGKGKIVNKSLFEKEHKVLNLTDYTKKHYPNKVLIKYKNESFQINNNTQLKIEPKKEVEKTSKKKLDFNLIVDYSKIIDSSKIEKKEKELNLFMEGKKEKIKNEGNGDAKEDDSSSSFSKEVSTTNFSQKIVTEKKSAKHLRQKSDLCNYNNPNLEKLLKISPTTPKRKNSPNFNDNNTTFNLGNSTNNNKYMLININNNKIGIKRQNKYKSGVKKVFSEKVSDNMALQRLDHAKHKLNQVTKNQVLKRQIFDILDKLIADPNINKKNSKKEKINNLYNKKKLVRAFEIIPQLSLIKQKINVLLETNENNSIDKNLNEKEIKQFISSVYFLECIGLEPLIILDEDNIKGNKQLINDIDIDIQLNNISDKKKFIRYYFHNLNKAKFFFEVLIENINHLQDSVYKNK